MVTIAAAAGAFFSGCIFGSSEIVLRLAGNDGAGSRFEVAGLPGDQIARLQGLARADGLSNAMTVRVAPLDGAAADLPALSGSYELDGGVLRFTPRFPLHPGTRYRVTFRQELAGAAAGSERIIEAIYEIPADPKTPSAVVSRVHPSSDVLPENLLKFYVHFSEPMSRGGVYRHVRILDDRGAAVVLPFLELGEELWDPQGRRLTLLLDPGRIKSGLVPREEDGPVFVAGRSYTLVIATTWLDARGAPLAREHRKRFAAGPPDVVSPDPRSWGLTLPRAGAAAPLEVDLREPLDRGLLEHSLWITDGAGAVVAGDAEVAAGETLWRFTPRQAWRSGRYALNARTTLEDLAGNSIGRPFEVDVFEGVDERIDVGTATVAFEIAER